MQIRQLDRLEIFTTVTIPGILLFYILGTLVIGLLVPSNDPRLNLKDVKGTAGASPFVIAIERAGIKSLPSVSTSCRISSKVDKIKFFLDYQCMSLNFCMVGGIQ